MAISFNNLEDHSWMYAAAKIYPALVHNYIFYKKVYTQGLENIPEDGAVIFAPNHQNALMDALIILCLKNWQPVFMARADIFAGQAMRRFLFFCKILPIFRMRDGKESLKENEAVFEKAVEVLRKRRYLVIYPEASHKGRRKLRPLKKGITRIAFMAEESSNYSLNVRIVPVGINYEDYFSFRTNVFINFGKPISVLDYRSLYAENPQRANHELVEKITEDLSQLIIDIKDSDNYDNFEIAREIFAPLIVRKEGKFVNNFKNKILAGKKVVAIMDKMREQQPDKYQELNDCLRQYRECLSSENLSDRIVRKRFKITGVVFRSICIVASLPLALAGLVANFLPYHLPFLFTSRIKDRNFHTSVRFGLYLILFPIWYVAIFSIMCRYVDSWWLRLALMLLAPVSGIFAHRYFNYIQRVAAMWRLVFHHKKPQFLRLKVLRRRIVKLLG